MTICLPSRRRAPVRVIEETTVQVPDSFPPQESEVIHVGNGCKRDSCWGEVEHVVNPAETEFCPYRWFNSSATVLILCRFSAPRTKNQIFPPVSSLEFFAVYLPNKNGS